MELRYFRDIDRREVDFVIMDKNKPVHFIECKRSADKHPALPLKYLKARFPNVKATQVSLEDRPDVMSKEDIRMCAAHVFLRELW
jgi:hypothetical protein